MVSNFNYFYNREISRNRSISERLEPFHHCVHCPFLPNHGIHPDLAKEMEKELDGRKKNSDGSNDKKMSGDNDAITDSDLSFYQLKFDSKGNRRS